MDFLLNWDYTVYNVWGFLQFIIIWACLSLTIIWKYFNGFKVIHLIESSNCIWLSQWWFRLFPIFCRKNNTSVHIFKHKSLSKRSSESLKFFLFFLFRPTQILCFLKCLAHVWSLLRNLLQVLQTAKIPSISDSNCIHLFICSFIHLSNIIWWHIKYVYVYVHQISISVLIMRLLI